MCPQHRSFWYAAPGHSPAGPAAAARYDGQLQTCGLVLLLASKLHCTGCDVGTEGS